MAAEKQTGAANLDAGSVHPNRPRRQDNGSFDCNICIHMARDGVLTLCGHLYCWRCLQLWLNRSESNGCPVCQSEVTPEKVVPVYGRGRGRVTDARPPLPRLVLHRPRLTKSEKKNRKKMLGR